MRSSRLAPFIALPLLAASGCGAPSEKAPERPAPRAKAPATTPVLPFLADDYDGALAEARARDLPLFVESWAPW
jgi:hypothetical protein